ncbi:hypothetical protein FQN54_002379 [Arachnomyces sp. PD_36]|nr:hypothetical protein FQN54_002379 [Arachnomyces sp. PD_36]
MFSSSPKRRKTSPSTAVPVDASNTNQRPESRDSRHSPTKRASFQSPTKSSLARSHPDVLSRVLSRSPEKTARKRSGSGVGGDGGPDSIERRAFGLRDRKALRPSLSGPVDVPSGAEGSGATAGDYRRRESSTGFVAPPRRLSRPSTERSSRQPSEARERSARPSSRSRNPEEQPTESTYDQGPDTAPDPAYLPAEELGEPDLPPTPTELGLQPRPVRPQGLLSSSPSTRKEKRNRKQGFGSTSSPLKPRVTKSIGDKRIRQPPTELTFENDQGFERVPESVKTARRLRDELSAQLRRLKKDIAILEKETQRIERPSDYPRPSRAAVEQLTSALTTTNPSCAPPPDPPPRQPISSILATLLPFSSAGPSSLSRGDQPRSPSPSPENQFKLDEPADLTPYLKIFAPLSLATHTSSSKPSLSSGAPSRSLTQTHTLTLSAPPPFSQQSYRVPVRLHTDPESQSILSISVLKNGSDLRDEPDSPGRPNIPTPLLNWMESRLNNPLLKHDISGLCWGVCRYWEAKVSRARIWAILSAKFRRIIPSSASNHRSRASSSNEDLDDDGLPTSGSDSVTSTRHLILHLERTWMVFSSPNEKAGAETQLLLSCSLALDPWTSEPELHLDICVSRSNGTAAGSGARYARVEREAKNLFKSLLTWNEGGEAPDATSVIRAVEGVLGIVFGTRGVGGSEASNVAKGAKGKERSRPTKKK